MSHQDHWIAAELETLDPARDYNRIISLATGYRVSLLIENLSYTINFLNVSQAQNGYETLLATNKVVDKPNLRFREGTELIQFWMTLGLDHPAVQASVEMLNKMHAGVARLVPGNFAEDIDYLMAYALIPVFEERLCEKLGEPGLPPFMQQAFMHWLEALSKLMTKEHGAQIGGFPQTYDELLRMVDKFENQGFEYDPRRNITGEAFLDQFSRDCFPDWPSFGRAFLLTFLPQSVCDTYRWEKPSDELQALAIEYLRLHRKELASGPDPREADLFKKLARPDGLTKMVRRAAEAGGLVDGPKELELASRSA